MKKFFGVIFGFVFLILILIFGFRKMECRWVLLDNYGDVEYYNVIEANIADSYYLYDVHNNDRHYIVEIKNDIVINDFEI